MAREQRADRADRPPGELENTTYELFIAALSILSIVNLVIIALARDPVIVNVMYIMNVPLSLIFLGDFGFRLATAASRRGYVLGQHGWADLLASLPLPQFKVLRLFRIWRAACSRPSCGTAPAAPCWWCCSC